MDLTQSYPRIIPADLLDRYVWLETRNAAAVMAASNPSEFEDLLQVLRSFRIDVNRDLLSAGGNETPTASLLNRGFRELGWREGDYATQVTSRLRLMPCRDIGENEATLRETEADTRSFLIDNIKGRAAVDVEWHAKEGHLDRDLPAYRSLYTEAAIDVAVIITMKRGELREWVKELDPDSTKYQTSTTTNTEKLTPKLVRGDGGGCPILVAGVSRSTT